MAIGLKVTATGPTAKLFTGWGWSWGSRLPPHPVNNFGKPIRDVGRDHILARERHLGHHDVGSGSNTVRLLDRPVSRRRHTDFDTSCVGDPLSLPALEWLGDLAGPGVRRGLARIERDSCASLVLRGEWRGVGSAPILEGFMSETAQPVGGAEPPPRFSARHGATVRECLVRSTFPVGGGRSPRSLCHFLCHFLRFFGSLGVWAGRVRLANNYGRLVGL